MYSGGSYVLLPTFAVGSAGITDAVDINNAGDVIGEYLVDGNLNYSFLAIPTVTTPVPVSSDFNGDRTSDILFRNDSTGDTGFYQMQNGGVRRLEILSPIHPPIIRSPASATSTVTVSRIFCFVAVPGGDVGFYQLNSDGTLQGLARYRRLQRSRLQRGRRRRLQR